jgi:hypothetical protein
MREPLYKQCGKQKQELGAVNDLIARLNVLLSFPDFQGNLNEILCRMQLLVADIFDAESCSITLVGENELPHSGTDARSGIGASKTGGLELVTATAMEVSLERGETQRLEDASEWPMSWPIVSHGKTIGLIHSKFTA